MKRTNNQHHRHRHGNVTHIVRGTLSVNRAGVGFVRDEERNVEVRIEPDKLGTALHGDTVEVAVYFAEPNQPVYGEVSRVISRAKTRFAGTVEKENGLLFVVPQDTRIHVDILVPIKKSHHATPGDKVLVELIRWDDPMKAPLGRIVKILGKSGENDAEMNAILYEYGIEPSFAKEIEREAAKIKRREELIMKEAIKERLDMRDVTTFTIDPETAKDFDDALSVRRLPDGKLEIGVHIADVSHYVAPDDAIDRQARERGTSVYLVDRTTPMLPEVLSNDLCSLNPATDRLVFSVIFTFSSTSDQKDAPLRILSRRLVPTVIHSNKRFTYEEAQSILDAGTGTYHEELRICDTIARKLEAANRKRGALVFGHSEFTFILDEHGKPIEVVRKVPIGTHSLIEQFMLLANKSVTEYVHETVPERERLFVYRIHEKPELEKLIELASFLKTLGYTLHIRGNTVSTKELNAILEESRGKPEEDVVHTAMIRSMQKAVYSIVNKGHFGLATKLYTHFTSPIRRYPDIIVHRLLKKYLVGDRVPRDKWRSYAALSDACSEAEQTATQAERDSVKLKQVEYMAQHIGETFDGVISGVVKWGIFVEDLSSGAEGLISVRDLTDDFFIFEPDKKRLIGEKTKKIYRLGDKVRIRVKRVSIENRTIDFALIE